MSEFKSLTDPIIYIVARLEAIANHFVFNPMRISATSLKILAILEKNGMMTPKEILDWVGGTKSNLSQRLRQLEKNSFIERTYALFENDKRKIAVKITALGIKKLQETTKRLRKVQVGLEKHFTASELANHQKFFNKLNKILGSKECELDKFFKCAKK